MTRLRQDFEQGVDVESSLPRRVVVLGVTGAGKSTLAARIAELVGAEHLELDSLNHGPNWTPRPAEEFVRGVEEFARRPKWVVDGNYVERTSGGLWPRADLIVWLDLPLPVVLLRIVRRTVLRIVRRTELWNGNREHWSALFGRHSLLVWAVRSHRRYRSELPVRLGELATSGVRLRSTAAVDEWLAELTRQARPIGRA